MKKKFYFGLFAVTMVAAAIVINVNLSLKRSGLSDVLLANIEALAQGEGGLDTNYEPVPYDCTIHVGVGGSFGPIKANAQGNVVISGARDCEAGGNKTCAPVTCAEIYASILGE